MAERPSEAAGGSRWRAAGRSPGGGGAAEPRVWLRLDRHQRVQQQMQIA
eukprot:COSAG01_NODE_27198_length_691_cov_3.472973_1_plen_48_part_10